MVLEAELPLDLLVAVAGVACLYSALIGLRPAILRSCNCGIDGGGELPF